MSLYTRPPLAGLTTQEAFGRLISDINVVLQEYRTVHGRNWGQVFQSSFSTSSKETTLCWCSVLILFMETLLILILWTSLLQEAITIMLLTLIISSLIVWENYKRLNELPFKIEKMLLQLDELTNDLHLWNESVYPDLYMPLSPCITLQWCYRDGTLVNLPWSLLVAGDVIILNPSQQITAKCEIIATKQILLPGATFSPIQMEVNGEDINNAEPKLHSHLESTFAQVLESPYKSVVQACLETHLERPTSFYTKERHVALTCIIESIILPVGILSFVGVCIYRLCILLWIGISVAPWTDLLLLQPLTYSFLLIPLALPVIMSFLNAIGNAKLYILANTLKKSSDKQNRTKNIYREAWNFFVGREEVLHRSEKFIHVLATVTALCCVDKKGILSWPNPTADEIFFLRTALNSKTKKRDTISEILDITHDNRNAFELHFDDTQWEKYLPNLKPLGLNILLNTCNNQTRATYAMFHSHIINEVHSNAHDIVVPVTSRRCLCELARIIGFADKATQVFKLEQELSCYRHIESDEACRSKLSKARIKFPFPHMTSVIVKEKACQSLQLMSQGTGDIILDVCEDFWDGSDLRPLTDYERKLILDFYQRTSLTSVCGAFAYKPVLSKVSNEMASLYLELPPSQGTRYLPYYSLSVEEGYLVTKDSSISSDCLYNLTEKRKSAEREVGDIDGIIDVQTRQVFIGMVAMQYEACLDMVQLVEQLDQACIRFVHFSKENELRSRLFSEKMGLESGWNCHISLNSGPDEEDKELSIEQASLLLGCDKKPERRATLAALMKLESKRPRRITTGSTEAGEESKLLSRCSTSVPEMAHLLAYETEHPNGNYEVIQATDDERSMKIPSVSFINNSLEPDSIIEETSLGSFGDAYENTDHRTPLIDMSNRAKLPKGIEEIRHHLKHDIDNVPLLVSLFTDCSANTTTSMISIMQNYGEVVLLFGSVCNIDNPGLFLQADASVALVPMFPQACRKQENFVPPKNNSAMPTDIANLLSGLPCAFVFEREDVNSIYPLIAQARHYMNNCSRNSLQFWLSSQLSLTVLTFLGSLAVLPSLFLLCDSIWLSCFIVPLLSLSICFATMGQVDEDIMDLASWKNHFHFDRHIFTYVLWFYGMKFLPSLLNIIAMSVFNLRYMCQNLGNNETCTWVYPHNDEPSQKKCSANWYCGDNAEKLLFVQQYTLFFIVLYLTLISACFLHRFKFIWVKNPLFNKIWILTSIGVIISQLVYGSIRLRFTVPFGIIPIASYCWAFSWIFVLLGLNELLRRQEIKINIRYQKRARLDFGTKLGMNSPF